MRNLLYVGNRLSSHGATATAIEVLGPLLEQEGFMVAYASSKKGKVARLADMLWQTFSRRKTTDFVIIDTYSTWNFWYAFFVSQLCHIFKIRYIPILHGGNLPKRLEKSPLFCRMIFKNSHVNVAPSGYLQRAFANAGFNVVKIPNPFDTAAFPFRERTRLAPKLLWVRSFAALYNPEMALRVFELLQKKYPDAALCMVGPEKDGTLKILKIKAESLGQNISFTGRLSKKEWAEKSVSYDIFINTARVDNTPFSVIEALSLGMAVVSTNVGGIPHLLEHKKNALLVDDDDADGMAGAIIELIENETLQRLILQQSHNLVQQFEWRNVRKKWREILL